MAATYATSVRDAAVNAVTTLYGYASLHTGSTPTSGNEVTGGSYARKAVAYPDSSAGASSVTVTFDVPAGVTVQSYSFQPAATGFSALQTDSFAAEAFTAAGTLSLTVPLTVNAA